ncbi:MAG TPA: serine/threonine-protein kinase [Thermoguttaceae bacterium]|nr:serine/threonine-protein kinase [Thermoguttaceae bacterium]
MTSSNRPTEASSTDGDRPRHEHVVLRPDELGAGPVRDDEQTVISGRRPVSPASDDGPLDGELGDLKPGDMVGHYKILDYVGGGGMGRVFRAEDTHLDRQVALKVLPPDQATDMDTVLRFRNEARSAARLDHENIARVYHVGEDHGFPFLVFEFVEGPTIRTLVEQRGPLPLDEAVSYALQVADALAHAARHDVVHRDIKPSNLIITSRGQVKVIDLGLARIQEVDQSGTDLTASGVTLGTFDYISPEQARDPRLVDTRSDIYSLGCAFFYMLAGRPPFPEGTVLQKLLQHQGDQPPDIRECRPELPEGVSCVLRKMLAKNPDDRYQTATELVEQLQGLAEQIGLRPLGSSHRSWGLPTTAKSPFGQRHLPWMAPVAALVCIVLALEVLWHTPWAAETADLGSNPTEQTSPPAEEDVSAPPTAANSSGSSEGVFAASDDSAASKPAFSSMRSNGTNKIGASGSKQTPARIGDLPFDEIHSSALPGFRFPGEPETSDDASVSMDPAMLPEEWPLSGATTIAAKGNGVLTVGAGTTGGRDYPTLAAACRAARAGDVIELCYNGRREERPIDLPGVKLIIRAAQDCRPVIVFRPDQDDPVEYPRSMFTLSGGDLSLVGVAIEMDLPRELSGNRWSVWELDASTRLRLQQLSMTIRNRHDHDVAVFRTKASPTLDPADEQQSLDSMMPVEITLTDCAIRGNAVTLHARSLQPIRMVWNNGLLAGGDWFLCVAGGDRNPGPADAIDVELKHLTAWLDKGLCLLDNSRFAPSQLPVKVDCSDSLLLLTSPQATLIEQFGENPANIAGPWFMWTGDRNGYEGVTLFWRVEDLRPDGTTQWFDFDEWKQQWPDQEIHSRAGRIDFVAPFDSNRAVDSCATADFRLSDAAEYWARGGASDGTDVGAAIDRLPWLPAGPEPATLHESPGNDSPFDGTAEPRIGFPGL